MVIIYKRWATCVKFNPYWHYFVKYISPFIKNKKGIVLEIGDGEVERVLAMQTIFPNLIELEFCFNKIHKLTEVKFINGDAQYIPFKDASFDCVISHHVIEHVPNDLLFLREVYRVLKKGGLAILGTPNRKRLPEILRAIFMGERKFPYLEHIREYTKEEIMNLASNLPFRLIEVDKSFFGFWGGTPFIIGLERPPNIFEKYAHFLFLKLQKDI